MSWNVREEAYDILNEWESGSLISDILENHLRKNQFEEKNNRAFLTRLTEGVVERKITLDRIIRIFSKVKFEKIKMEIRTVLRMGVYQILYMDGVPDRAAISESVNIVKNHHMNGLDGYVNAVLRSVSKDWNIGQESQIRRMIDENISVKYSTPKWLTELLISEYGTSECEKILADQYNPHDTVIRVNETRTSAEELKKLMESAGVSVKYGNYVKNSLRISGYDFIRKLPGFAEGLFMVQDESSIMAVEAAGIRRGDFVIDVCAAPGGKTSYAAELTGPEGKVVSRDISKEKTDMIAENVSRLILPNVEIEIKDAAVPDKNNFEKADVVIADVPCSGLGVMSRKCDIKYNVKKESINTLAEKGQKILQNAACLLKKGGVLLFSTCTIDRIENHDNAVKLIEWADKNGFEFEIKNEKTLLQSSGKSDGFYYCVMKRMK